MTDLPEVLESLVNNISHNRAVWEQCGGSAEARPLTWGSADVAAFSAPDLLLIADCVYYEESVEPLVETMVALCGDNTEVLLCQEQRDTERQQHAWALFQELLQRHFDCKPIPITDQHPVYSADEIVIFRGKKKVQS